MGSLAGPESPSPCSHRTKLRAIGSGFEEGWFGCESSMNRMVPIRVIPITAMGFANSLSFIAGRPWSTFSSFSHNWGNRCEKTSLLLSKEQRRTTVIPSSLLGPNVCRTSNKATQIHEAAVAAMFYVIFNIKILHVYIVW